MSKASPVEELIKTIRRLCDARVARLPAGVRLILRSPSAVVGLVLTLLLVGTSLLTPVLAPFDPLEVDFAVRTRPPSPRHLLGTDTYGRDILSRVLWGSRTSLLFGAGSVAIGSAIGVTTGLISGYLGGWTDAIVMRIVDIFIAFRLLLLAITIVAILGPGAGNTMLAIGISLFAIFARLARAEVLAVKEREYIEAARSVGASGRRIIFRHVTPNIMDALVVLATLRLGGAILAEASLSFLGLGTGPPAPSWGLMVSEGLSVLSEAPWLCLAPGVAIMLTVLGFNLLGDGLRDVLDPRLRGR